MANLSIIPYIFYKFKTSKPSHSLYGCSVVVNTWLEDTIQVLRLIERSNDDLTGLLEYFIFRILFWSSETKNVSYIRWIQMWMQFSVSLLERNHNFSRSKTDVNYFESNQSWIDCNETVYLLSLILQWLSFSSLPHIIDVVFFPYKWSTI